MIEMGGIVLRGSASVVEARQKVKGLAEALTLDPLETSRLAIITSELARTLLLGGGRETHRSRAERFDDRRGARSAICGRPRPETEAEGGALLQ